MNKFEDYFHKTFIWIINAIGVLTVLTGFITVFFQLFVYLKNGKWTDINLSFFVLFFPTELVKWIDNPTNWYGFHKITLWILETTPLSLFLMVVGFLIKLSVDND